MIGLGWSWMKEANISAQSKAPFRAITNGTEDHSQVLLLHLTYSQSTLIFKRPGLGRTFSQNL